MREGSRAAVAAVAFLLVLSARSAGSGLGQTDVCARIELQRLDALYDLLDAHAGEIWPGWDNYTDVEFRTAFPNRVRMIVNPQGEPAAAYKIVEGTTVRGRKVCLDRTDEIPLAVKPPLGRGGAAQFGWVYINLEALENIPAPEACGRENYAQWEHAQSESQILTYAHELFHEYQTVVWPSRKKAASSVIRMRGRAAQAPARPSAPRRQDRGDPGIPPIYYVPLSYPVFKEIEGRAILAAYGAKDDREALEYLKDAMAARRIRHDNMPEDEVAREINVTVGEGTAQYAQVKLAQAVLGSGYRGEGILRDDPYFFDFRFMDEYVRQWTVRQMEASCLNTFDARPFHYSFGMFAGLLCDRFVPAWKKDFLESGRTFDDLIEGFLGLNDREREDVGGRLKTKYPYDEIVARHGRLIKERDDAIALVEGRAGKRFVVDWTATRVHFPHDRPSRPRAEAQLQDDLPPRYREDDLRRGRTRRAGHADGPLLELSSRVGGYGRSGGREGLSADLREQGGGRLSGRYADDGGIRPQSPRDQARRKGGRDVGRDPVPNPPRRE